MGTRLAKISATPGKTRMVNVYAVPQALYFLDLPGYGYARVAKGQREEFRRLVYHVLARPRLTGAIWLLDIRHEPSTDDRMMQELLIERGTHVLAALTKGDKLPRTQRAAREQSLRATLNLPDDQIVVTSAKTGDGIVDLRAAIAGLVQDGMTS